VVPATVALDREGLMDGSWPLGRVHHPTIRRRADRKWVVVCPDCEKEQEGETPVGINVPVDSREVAEMLWENHAEVRRPTRRGT
jgi:hypothetical protein